MRLGSMTHDPSLMLGVVKAPPEYLPASKLHLDVERRRVWVDFDLHDVPCTLGLPERDDIDVVSALELRRDQLPRSCEGERSVEPARGVDHLRWMPLRWTPGAEFSSVPQARVPRRPGELTPGRFLDAHR